MTPIFFLFYFFFHVLALSLYQQRWENPVFSHLNLCSSYYGNTSLTVLLLFKLCPFIISSLNLSQANTRFQGFKNKSKIKSWSWEASSLGRRWGHILLQFCNKVIYKAQGKINVVIKFPHGVEASEKVLWKKGSSNWSFCNSRWAEQEYAHENRSWYKHAALGNSKKPGVNQLWGV